MDVGAMDDLYGDFGQESYDPVLNHDEDSVDIYSGLGNSPTADGDRGQQGTFLSPQRLKESMDLYEELVTEEQEQKQATYNEIKSQLEAAQNQVKELLAKVQQMQTQNSNLHRENTSLKKNICALIKTARMEIVRKDEEINKLLNRSSRGSFLSSRPERSEEGWLRSRASTGHSSHSTVDTVRKLQDLKANRELTETPQQKLENRPSSQSVCRETAKDTALLSLTKPERSIRNLNAPLHPQHTQSHKHVSSDRMSVNSEKKCADSEAEVASSQSSSTVREKNIDVKALRRVAGEKQSEKQSCSRQDKEQSSKEKVPSAKPPCSTEAGKLSGEQRESVKITSSKSQSQSHEHPVALRRSGRSKSPSSQHHESHGQKSRQPSAEVHTQSRNRGDGASEKRQKQGSTEHHRKEERRQAETDSTERKRTRGDGNKEHEAKRVRESEGRSRQEESRRSTKSEASKDYHRRSAKESEGSVGRSAGDKKDGSCIVGLETGRDSTPGSHVRRKNDDKSADKRKNSTRTDEQSSKSQVTSSKKHTKDTKRSGSHVGHSGSDRCSVKVKRVDIDYDKGRNRAEKETDVPDRAAENCVSASGDQREPCKVDIEHIGDSVQVNPVADADIQSPKMLTSGSAIVEENSPKRKLTFMETLNLTLSPVKKSGEAADSLPEDAISSNSAEHNVSFELGEEFCVIDEIDISTQSVENMDHNSAPSNGSTHQSPINNTQHIIGQVLTSDSEGQKTDPQEVVKKNEQESQEAFNKDKCESATPPLEKTCTDSENQENESVSKADESSASASVLPELLETSQCVMDKPVASEGFLPMEGSELGDKPLAPLANVECEKDGPQASVGKPDEERSNSFNEEKELYGQLQQQVPLQGDSSQDEVSTSAISLPCSNFEIPVSLEVVSSTVGVDMNCNNKADGADAEMPVSTEITRGFKEAELNPATVERSQADILTISSSAKENERSPEQARSPDSTGNEVQNYKPSSSVVVPHDEDSMMLTLSRIKVIPEAISPLTSPVRPMKKVQQPQGGKESHVKSLSKDLSSTASAEDKDVNKMDMNKENKRPHSSPTSGILTDQEALSSTATEEELEEGEIVSESDEEGALTIQSPPNKNTASSLSNQASPKTPKLEKRGQAAPTITPKCRQRGKNGTADSKDSPTFNKRRFKTVSVPSRSKILTFAEFMNKLSFIRSELRRKYMKLHKNVTKTAFCCIVDMSLASFTEFVDGVDFHRFHRQGNEIKPRLNKIISSIISNVSKNGIVNRIFEQRAEDLKQKLWTFVDGQFDFLFKELKAELKGGSEHSKNTPALETKRSSPRLKKDLNIGKAQAEEPVKAAEHRPSKRPKIVNAAKGKQLKPNTTVQSLPCRVRGLGSRGKNIKAIMEGGAQVQEVQTSDQVPNVSSYDKPLQESVPLAPENKTYARHLSQSGSVQDFNILTEQQASSLTFNLVADAQMGDIFRCLLQGSDLMETSISLGDNQSWPLNTPRKEGQTGESLIGIMTPSKMITPSKLITTWTSISPYKFVSPNSKIQMPLNPALLDESCLLEVPSNHPPNLSAPTLTSQQAYSILAEDLAVSLTIPSPLKSDSHLSFLHPLSGQPLSAPSSVISAHYSEDALLEGEDATEQDIHLSLDTDNSSRGSSTTGTWEGGEPVAFQYRPNLPIQAEVMERSNDHFILRIRQTSTGTQEEPQPEAPSTADTAAGMCHESKSLTPHESSDSGSPVLSELQASANKEILAERATTDISSDVLEGSNVAVVSESTANLDRQDFESTTIACVAPTANGCTVASTTKDDALESKTSRERVSRKRRKHRSGPKAKRSRPEKSQERHEKQRHKRRSKSKDEKTPSKNEKKILSPQLSPSSLSAKNVIRKKGEVVVTWTREEDRDILVELKLKGASSKTFATLSAKLKKSQSQIEERFTQLMKLFKKKEKMES